MNNTVAHQKLVDDVLFAVSSTNLARVWKNSTGVGTDLHSKRVIRFGLVGSGDILGLMRNGRFLTIEIKTGSGKLSAQQQNFKKMVEAFNGLYILARDVETPVLIIRKAIGESCNNLATISYQKDTT